jgi:drug/metabolite transporter (DMT)-like permease
MTYRPTPFDWFLIAVLVIAWGSSFVMSKLALKEVDPAWIAAARIVIGAAVVTAFAGARGQLPKFTTTKTAYYAWLGLIGNALPFVLITWGMLFITSGVAGLLMGAIPLFTIALSHLLLPNEPLTATKTAGFLIGFVGIIVLIGADALFNISFSGNELIGELAVILGCLCYAVNGVTAKRFGTGGVYEQSSGVLILASVLAVTFALLTQPFPLHKISGSALLALIGLGLIPTGFATVVWFKAISRTGPSFTSITNYLVPVYAVAFGAILLGEPISWNVLAALALILVGVFVSRIKQQPSR